MKDIFDTKSTMLEQEKNTAIVKKDKAHLKLNSILLLFIKNILGKLVPNQPTEYIWHLNPPIQIFQWIQEEFEIYK